MSEIRDCAVHEIRCNKCGQAILNEAAIQSIAERVCEVLAREVEREARAITADNSMENDDAVWRHGLADGFVAASEQVIRIPRDWAKELEDKK